MPSKPTFSSPHVRGSRSPKLSVATLGVMLMCGVVGCKKTAKADESTLTPLCLEVARSTYTPQHLAQLERAFFTDRRSRELLNLNALTLSSFREVEASATLGTYELIFDFVDQKGEPIVFHNNSETGGVKLEGLNHVVFRGSCEISWSFFKRNAFQRSFKISALSHERFKQVIQKDKVQKKNAL
jgi:hypothetical protein